MIGSVVTGTLAATMLIPGAVAAAQPGITFNLEMLGDCVSGRAAPNSTVDFTWRASNGTPKGQGTTDSTTYGHWGYCSTDPEVWLQPGDKIKVSDGSATRTYVVPDFSMILDRSAAEARGSGPAGRTIRICSTWALFSDYEKCHSTRVGQNGEWAFHPHGGHIYGGVWASAYWTSPNNDTLTVHAQAPRLDVTLGKSTFSGGSDPRATVDISINWFLTVSGHATGDQYGGFEGQFRNAKHRLVKIVAGDHISSPSLAADEEWIMPNIEASADRTTDVLTGRCFDTGTSDHWLQVTVLHSGHFRGAGVADTEPDGSFTLDFHDPGGFWSPTNIISGDHLVVMCMQNTGDAAQLKFRVP